MDIRMIEALIVSFLAAQLFFLLIFFLAVSRDDYGTVDVFWGLSIVFNALILGLYFMDSLTVHFFIVAAGVTLWGIRLSIHLGQRNWKKPEDFRYVDMRKKWGKNIKRNAYLNVFVTQGFFSFLMSLALVGSLFVSDALSWVGLILAAFVFAVGLYFETAADRTLARFKKDPANKGKICDQGVWSISRHPNYFGEIVLWWSYPLLLIFSGITPGLGLALISALIITWLLVFVSGVPLLEKRYKNDIPYQLYAERTSKLIPWFKKRDPKVS